MRRKFLYIFACLFCISTFAQSVDKIFSIPEFSFSKIRYQSNPFPSYFLKADTSIYKSTFKFSSLTFPNKPIATEVKPSVVVITPTYNFSSPSFSTPQIQTMNWWQAMGKIGMGLTRGLVFNDYNSNYTLDD